MDFGEKLSAARKAKGFSQEELAAKIEVSRQAISKWETGSAQPETANILKLCEVLEISPNELFGFEEKVPAPENEPKNKNTKRFFIIIATVILFSAFLIWVSENRSINQFYRPKNLPISITDCQYKVIPEESNEEFVAVEMVFSFETVKSNQSFHLSVISNYPDGKTFTEYYSAARFGTLGKQCSAGIKLPAGGDAHIILASREVSREAAKSIGWFYDITEESCVLEEHPDMYK